jgi:gliding motility-associated-like protein
LFTNPTHLYSEPGSYDVTLKVVSAEGCISQLTVPDAVEVYPVPEADFVTSPPKANILLPIINFHDTGAGATIWNWDFGDQTTGTDQNPIHTYADAGTYQIVLYVMNDYGCRDTAYGEIIIEGTSTLYIPNAFTPNGDGINDEFLIYGIGLEDVELSIFNRWGHRIFVSSNQSAGWKGTDSFTGDICPEGVYVYLARVKKAGGAIEELTGRVTLVH